MFPHYNFHKFTWTSSDGKTHHRIYYILIDRQRHSCVLDALSLKEADCDNGITLMVVEFMDRVAVNKQRSHRFHVSD
jgi:hypothetical protein